MAVPGVKTVAVRFTSNVVYRKNLAMPNAVRLGGIRNVLAVAAGKGGVGKSTVAANLALALRDEGARVAIMDADIYGPSMPLMFASPAASRRSRRREARPHAGHGMGHVHGAPHRGGKSVVCAGP